MVTGAQTYSAVVTWRDQLTTSALNLTTAQVIEALTQINRLFDQHGVSAGDRIRVFVLPESDTRH